MGRHREPMVGSPPSPLSSATSRGAAARAPRRALALLVLASALLGGCGRRAEPEPTPKPAAKASSSSQPLVLARGVRFVHARAGVGVAELVREEQARAEQDGRRLVVYVGATWCEPCHFFHAAAGRGDLDDAFPSLTLLEFDLDEDRERLVTAGYVSQYIPLFAMPGADGRASGRKIEGGVKGDGAVAELTPRLSLLLSK